MSGNIRNLRDSFLHFLADNLPLNSVHALRFSKTTPLNSSLQIGQINVAFHDSTYSANAPSNQFVTLDILHDDELAALDLEETLVVLLQLAGYSPLLDYSVTTQGPVAIGNTNFVWNPQGLKFRTVSSIDYFHRSAVLELSTRYVQAGITSVVVAGPGGRAIVAQLTAPTEVINVTASQNISGYVAVGLVAGLAVQADSSDISQLEGLLGIATGGALAASSVSVQFTGQITYNGWAWALGTPIFLGTNGALTQIPPTVGFSQVVGKPITTTSMMVDIQSPVVL